MLRHSVKENFQREGRLSFITVREEELNLVAVQGQGDERTQVREGRQQVRIVTQIKIDILKRETQVL